MRVLIVDDLELARRAIRGIVIAAEGFVVVGEASGLLTATEAMSRLQPDLVILDLNIPGVDEVAVLQQIKYEWPATIVIMLSDRSADADHLLPKSVKPEELLALLRRCGSSAA